MPSSHAGRFGLAVFALGIILLLGVFFIAYALFTNTGIDLARAETNPQTPLPPLSDFLASAAIRFGFLIVMGIVSSLIAGKGLSLYVAAREADKA